MRILTRCPRRVKYLLGFSSPFLTRLVRKKKFGRHGWDYTLIFKYLLIKQACNLTYRDLFCDVSSRDSAEREAF